MSDDMRRDRSDLARALLLGYTDEQLDEADYTDSVIDQFVDLGVLLQHRIVSDGAIWTTYAHCVLRYWEALHSHIAWVRRKYKDQTYFSEFEDLYRRIKKVEERNTKNKVALGTPELKRFLFDELREDLEPIRVRKYAATDLKRVLEIEALAFAPTFAYPRPQFEDLHRRHGHGFLVAELLQAKVIGYVVGYVSHQVGELDSIAVDPDFALLGVGRRLALASLQTFRARKARRATLEVNTENNGALQFFERLGFRRDATLHDYYAPAVHAYRMQLQL